jgi:hypothetical protein
MRLTLKRLSQTTASVQDKRWRRKIRSTKKKSYLLRGQKWHGKNRTITLKCPFAINISSKKNRQYTLGFFAKIRRHVIDLNQPVTLDLTELKYVMPSAALLMIAELDRAKRLMGQDFRVSLVPSTTHRINAVLDQIGFSNICETRLSNENIDEADDELVRHWRYATGERINDQTAKAFVNIQGRIAPALQQGLWKSISEAIGNSCLHAYLEERGTDSRDLANKRWWMLSQEKDGTLSVTVADLGIGIPRSLPLKWERSTLSKVYDRLIGGGQDERAIRAAMEVGATRTGQQHRGKGLPQIWHDLRADRNASIHIYSNKGLLGWTGRGDKENSQEFTDSIFGTVISWSIAVSEASNEL